MNGLLYMSCIPRLSARSFHLSLLCPLTWMNSTFLCCNTSAYIFLMLWISSTFFFPLYIPWTLLAAYSLSYRITAGLQTGKSLQLSLSHNKASPMAQSSPVLLEAIQYEKEEETYLYETNFCTNKEWRCLSNYDRSK